MSQITPRKLLISLSSLPGVGPKLITKLLDYYSGAEGLLKAWEAEDEMLSKLRKRWEEQPKMSVHSENDQNLVIGVDEAYPYLLSNIPDPPVVLNYRGNISVDWNRSIAVVGTRKFSEQGKRNTEMLVRELVNSGINIVSGMAYGIDAIAHSTCIEYGGKTIAVLAGPVGHPSPKGNRFLYERIIDSGGLVLSEYEDDVAVVPGMFAARNRVVAGLTPLTLVIEAGEGSGALITAKIAFGYDRLVCALPGDIGRVSMVGSNRLVAEGIAKLVTSATDVLNELNLTINRGGISAIVENDRVQSLDVESRKLLDLLTRSGPMDLDQICVQFDITSEHSLSLLTTLEVEGLVFRQVDGKYAA